MAESRIGARQVGRRAMVVCGALVVPPSSSVYTPQDLANRLVALDFGNGTAYAGLQMLEGAMPRQAIKTCSFDANPAKRYAALMAGEFEATVLQEPWITVAEKAGCWLISTTFFYGTWGWPTLRLIGMYTPRSFEPVRKRRAGSTPTEGEAALVDKTDDIPVFGKA